MRGHCSWCLEEAEHTAIKTRRFKRNIYKCWICGGFGVSCRTCSNLARSTSKEAFATDHDPGLGFWSKQFCAQCAGEIHSFEDKGIRIDRLEDYRLILEAKRRNLPNTLFGRLREFGITPVNEGAGGPPVLFINGFLSETDPDVECWVRGLEPVFPNSPVYHLAWESKALSSLWKTMLNLNLLAGAVPKIFTSRAVLASYAVARFAPGVRFPVSIAGSVALPVLNALAQWYSALGKAWLTGILLADILARTRLREIVLIGHSLGARVIYFALLSLARRRRRIVRDAYLLGGAVGRSPIDDWVSASDSVNQHIHNFISSNDRALYWAYRASVFGASTPIGIAAIGAGDDSKCRDHDDLSPLISGGALGGHDKWKAHLTDVFNCLKEKGFAA